MARKAVRKFKSRLEKNTDKGGAWIVSYQLLETRNDGLGGIEDKVIQSETKAWSNASAGKRWVKEKVVSLTPRKSVKFVIKAIFNTKPSVIEGEFEFKTEVKV